MGAGRSAMARAVVERVESALSPDEAVWSFARARGAAILESSRPGGAWARYSIFACEPFRVVEIRGRGCAIRAFAERARGVPACDGPEEVPFAGGWIGAFTYEGGLGAERIARAGVDDLGLPAARFGLYDSAAVYDHQLRRWYAAAIEWPGALGDRRPAVRARLDAMHKRLRPFVPDEPDEAVAGDAGEWESNISREAYLAKIERAKRYIAAGDIYQVNLTQRFTARTGLTPVGLYGRLREITPSSHGAFLRWGETSVLCASPELFLDLRGGCSAVPFGVRTEARSLTLGVRKEARSLGVRKEAHSLTLGVRKGDPSVPCADGGNPLRSPLVRGTARSLTLGVREGDSSVPFVDGGNPLWSPLVRGTAGSLALGGWRVVTRPIKGTRARRGDPVSDAAARGDLETSEKERAELNMIVDLLRNDLGRVCSYGSIRVVDPGCIEEHPTVFHRTATIEGRLAAGRTWADLLAASFPGGSVTGAPKIRAMQIISELEPTTRGVYCGSIGWIGLDGSMSLNLAIRTMVQRKDVVHAYAGGAIVADSEPAAEYEETLAKAAGMLRALGCGVGPEPLAVAEAAAS